MKRHGGALLSSIRIDRTSDRRFSVQLYMALRELLLSGAFNIGDRMPATRTLALEIGVSRTTVIDAIDRLVSEGLLESRVGAGTFVSKTLAAQIRLSGSGKGVEGNVATPRLSRMTVRTSHAFTTRSRLPHKSTPFITALPALDAFPMAQWARLSARHWRKARDQIAGYGEPFGFGRLRSSIAQQLNAARGIKCDPEQIFIVNGAQHAFATIGLMLVNPGEAIWFENPGAVGARNAFLACDARLVPVDIDAEGFCVEDALKKQSDFRLAFVTPSHQQPLGLVMSLARRLALLQAAKDADAMIVEDDYDGEFYYGEQPPPTLKSIDTQERVIYVGTFSKSLFPSLRLGYILSPKGLVESFERLFTTWQSGAPTFNQAIVADFMDEGIFATHVRTMRQIYKERYEALVDSSDRIGEWVDLQSTGGGFHTAGFLRTQIEEADIVAAAAAAGITTAALGRYAIAPYPKTGLVFGFGSTPPEDIRTGMETLGRVMNQLGKERQLV